MSILILGRPTSTVFFALDPKDPLARNIHAVTQMIFETGENYTPVDVTLSTALGYGTQDYLLS